MTFYYLGFYLKKILIKTFEEIAKNFGSLCVTDFPIYVQGFDLNYGKEKTKPIMLMKQPGSNENVWLSSVFMRLILNFFFHLCQKGKSTETVTNCKQRQWNPIYKIETKKGTRKMFNYNTLQMISKIESVLYTYYTLLLLVLLFCN